MFGFQNKMKPFKIRSLHDNKKYGIAAGDLLELLKKGCNLLQLPLSGAHVCLYADGTKVTKEFLTTLPDNTELVLLGRGETWGGAVCDIAHLLGSDQRTEDLIQMAKGLLSDEKSFKRQKILSDLLRNLEDTSELESRDEDQDWFTGLATRFKTKSAYLKDNCACRIRSYKRELDDAAKSEHEPKVRLGCLQASEKLSRMLREDKNIGCYFDRTQKDARRLCTREGWFTCQGSFDQAKCPSLHSINPYGSRERRILFSTWNLDHRIEKRRSIIPALLEALRHHKCKDINLDYFYRLLFTWENLKLVHIVCHKKEAHHLQCDPKQIFTQDNKEQRKKMRLK
ncbi:DNA fragmentation factor subunit beta isoform X2 [Stigmatopora argus]